MCQHGGLHVLRYQMTACVSLNMAAQTDRGIPLSALNPNFLNSNSTSHTGPFSAIAELIDNAYDPDVNAKQFWIDKTIVKGQECLIFMDNGAGMDYDKMHKMLSFGFSDKKSVKDHVPVGIYGNGFKSGSMRLGKDAIVFSKRADTMCVGLLSQTYLTKIEAKHVVVPIAMFTRTGQTSCHAPEHAASVEDILQYSLFETEEELMCELNAINGPCSMNSTGTRIIIWNLRKNSLGESEFDFSADRYDIQIPAESLSESTKELYKKPEHVMHSGPECLYSLRAYCSILYLKPRMQIIIRGQKVRTELISKSLAHIVKDKYKPKLPSIKKPVPITFGYNTKSKEQYGVMLYHKNRLIKAYERVACQQKANNKGVGVIGVIECNFLTPTHNKQDFDYTEDYRKTMYSLNTKLEDYWKEVHHRFQQKSNIPVEDIPKQPDQIWVQCDVCLKWRKLPDGIDTKQLPEKWFCHMNPDPQYRSCAVEAEPEDSDDDQVYQKTYKQHERNEKLKQAQSKQQMEQEQKQAEQKKITALTMQNADLMRKKQELERQLRFGPTTSPRTPDQAQPTPSSSRVRSADFRSSDNMPVISEVKSLFATPTRKKRSLGLSAKNGMEKRARKLIRFDKTPGSPSIGTASPDTCVLPSEFILDDDGGGGGGKETRGGAPNEDDDDIVVIETNSTPRPNLSTSDLSIVKTEKFSDDNGMDTSVATDTTVAAPLPPPGGHVCTLTQTEAMEVMKHEMEDLEGKEEGVKNKEGERGICQSETGQGLLALERSTNQEPTIKSVTSLEKDNTELNSREGTSEASIQTLDGNTVKLEVQEDEPVNGEILERLTGRAAKPGAEEYKTLYLQAQGEVEQLRRELDELKREKAQAGVEKKVEGEEGSAGERAQSDGGRTVAEVEDELACHVDLLMKELDQRIKQKEELENRLKDLQEERDCLMNRNEGLQKDLEEMKRDHEKIQLRLEDRWFQTDFPQCNQDESGMAIEGPSHGESASKGETQDEPGMERGQGDDTTQTCNLILKKLRQNIACLLVNYVPALDIQQVNFDCDVIDDILSQVVEQISCPLAAWQSS